MHYELKIKASTTNVKNIFIDQCLPVIIKCSNCLTTREKAALIAEDSVKVNARHEKSNAKIKCQVCDREYEIDMKSNKKNKYVHWLDAMNRNSEIYYLSDVDNGVFTVSFLESRGCEIVEVKNLIINVLSADGSLFKGIELENQSWCGNDKNGKSIKIDSLSYFLEAVKKKK